MIFDEELLRESAREECTRFGLKMSPEEFVLFCKSYRQGMELASGLIDSAMSQVEKSSERIIFLELGGVAAGAIAVIGLLERQMLQRL